MASKDLFDDIQIQDRIPMPAKLYGSWVCCDGEREQVMIYPTRAGTYKEKETAEFIISDVRMLDVNDLKLNGKVIVDTASARIDGSFNSLIQNLTAGFGTGEEFMNIEGYNLLASILYDLTYSVGQRNTLGCAMGFAPTETYTTVATGGDILEGATYPDATAIQKPTISTTIIDNEATTDLMVYNDDANNSRRFSLPLLSLLGSRKYIPLPFLPSLKIKVKFTENNIALCTDATNTTAKYTIEDLHLVCDMVKMPPKYFDLYNDLIMSGKALINYPCFEYFEDPIITGLSSGKQQITTTYKWLTHVLSVFQKTSTLTSAERMLRKITAHGRYNISEAFYQLGSVKYPSHTSMDVTDKSRTMSELYKCFNYTLAEQQLPNSVMFEVPKAGAVKVDKYMSSTTDVIVENQINPTDLTFTAADGEILTYYKPCIPYKFVLGYSFRVHNDEPTLTSGIDTTGPNQAIQINVKFGANVPHPITMRTFVGHDRFLKILPEKKYEVQK